MRIVCYGKKPYYSFFYRAVTILKHSGRCQWIEDKKLTDLGIIEKSPFAQWRRNWNSRRRAWLRDSYNRRHYGPQAPKFAERLWIPTPQLQQFIKHWSSKQSGQVVSQWPANPPVAITALTTIKACLAHWRDGADWEETGIFAVMMAAIDKQGRVDRMRSLEDVQQRYAYLAKVCAEGGLQTRQQLLKGNFREEGGILVHIGPDGQPYFGGKGTHRLAMAIAAELPCFPAQLGCVHQAGINALPALRQ